MTKNTLHLTFSSGGREYRMGPGEAVGIRSVSGLETIRPIYATQDNALQDGVTILGHKLGPRSIHIECSYRSSDNNGQKRADTIRFFNPNLPGRLRVTRDGHPRDIFYRIEGWTFAGRRNLDNKLAMIIDLICADPFFQAVDNYGKNVAATVPQFAFPWRALPERLETEKNAYAAEGRGLLLGGVIAGYKVSSGTVDLYNGGDVPVGLQVHFTATRGPASNPALAITGASDYVRAIVDMQQGDALVIDTDLHNRQSQAVTLNGKPAFALLDRGSTPIQMAVGDNQLYYQADSGRENLDVRIYYRPLYLGA